jgi:hypothetical protein
MALTMAAERRADLAPKKAHVMTVLDLDGSQPGQPPIRERIETGAAARLDLRDMGRKLRLWAWDRDYAAFARRLPAPTGAPEIFLLGSGDYHHLTAALIERRAEPLTVIHFDNHPDWAWTYPRRHCGSWVNAALEMAHVRRVVTIGCCSDDLAKLDRPGQNLAALRSGQLEMHPWYRTPTATDQDSAPIPGHVIAHGELAWTNLAGEDWASFLAGLIARLPTDAIWITIDKDVLAREDAATNWDQGALPLRLLEQAIATLARARRVLGVDLCGDYSPAGHRHPMKIAEAWLDQPRRAPRDLSLNERTNARLLALLEDVL